MPAETTYTALRENLASFLDSVVTIAKSSWSAVAAHATWPLSPQMNSPASWKPRTCSAPPKMQNDCWQP